LASPLYCFQYAPYCGVVIGAARSSSATETPTLKLCGAPAPAATSAAVDAKGTELNTGSRPTSPDKLRLVDREVELLFRALCRDPAGAVDYKEIMIALALVCGSAQPDEKLRFVFNLFDGNADGSLTRTQLLALLRASLTVVLALSSATAPASPSPGTALDPRHRVSLAVLADRDGRVSDAVAEAAEPFFESTAKAKGFRAAADADALVTWERVAAVARERRDVAAWLHSVELM